MKKVIKKLFIFSLTILTIFFISSCDAKAYFVLLDNSIEMERYSEYELNYDIKNLDISEVEFISSDLNIIKIKNGIVTAIKTGRASITAKYEDNEFTCDVLVLQNTVGRSLSVDKDYLEIKKDESAKLTFTLRESGKEITSKMVYESSDPSIVNVDGSGNVTAINYGSAIVSAFTIYKGQKFTKDVLVEVLNLSTKKVSFDFVDDNHTGSSLNLVSESVGGFNSEEVYIYHSSGDFNSRIFIKDNLSYEGFDKIAFKIKFPTIYTEYTSLYLGDTSPVSLGRGDLVTKNNAFIFYDEKGRIASYLRNSKVYTCVIDLKYLSDKNEAFGFMFNEEYESYISSFELVTNDYLYHKLGFEKPIEEPALNFIYMENQDTLDYIANDYFGSSFIAYSTGTEASWSEECWENRFGLGGLKAKEYHNFSYYQFDIVLTDINFREIRIWNGGFDIKVSPNYNLSSSKVQPNEIKADDLEIYKNGELIERGTSLEKDVIYTFKIKIQDNLSNEAFGIVVNSRTKIIIYLNNPSLPNF